MEEYNRQYLERLAHKWRDGTLSKEEQAYFDHWYQSERNETVELPEGYAKNPIALRDRMHEKIKEQVKYRQGQDHREMSIVWKRLLIAAAIIVMISILVLIYYKNFPDRYVLQDKSSQYNNYVASGGTKAVLTLANGKKITLDSTGSQSILQQGSAIARANNGSLTYGGTPESDINVDNFNTLETPRGGQYRIVLPDGTKVWLNAASAIKYPTAFTGKERKVELNGEAYFEVAHNKVKPFYVETRGQTLQVLGTHFNVSAYADEQITTTTLSQGSIKLSSDNGSVQIKPGQQSVLKDKQFKITKIDTTLALAWKDGQFAFAKTNIQTVLRQVSRWYNIDIIYQGQAPDFTLSGEVSRKEDLSAILRILRASDVHFVQQGRRLTITP